MPTALALSPHLDDAAFSCGGTLRWLSGAGWRVVVATVFTATVPDPRGFALACQLDKGLGPEVDYMRLRREEDAAALGLLGAEPRHLPFAEAPHRGYDSAPALFAEPRDEDAGIVLELADALAALLRDLAPDLLLAPQAVGGHVDHVQVVRALSSLVPEASILWWRDYPYTVRPDTPRAPFAERFALLPGLDVALEPAAEVAKLAACAAYASQVGFQFGGEAALRARLAAERGQEHFALSGEVPDVAPAPSPP